MTIDLERATSDTAPLLANLLELYVHDMSEIFQIELGPDGRFGYGKLSRYWSDPPRHHPFLITCDGRVAGFALATRGSPATADPDDLDLAEFFVLRGYRRLGVGRAAAMALWDRVPGQWVVRVSDANRTGRLFWPEVIRAYTSGAFTAGDEPGDPHGWRILTFATRARTDE